MSDQRLRELERRAATGDVEARRALMAGQLRAAATHDPRVDPQRGDVVQAGRSEGLLQALGERFPERVDQLLAQEQPGG